MGLGRVRTFATGSGLGNLRVMGLGLGIYDGVRSRVFAIGLGVEHLRLCWEYLRQGHYTQHKNTMVLPHYHTTTHTQTPQNIITEQR